jgi:hypothetical protein
MKKLALTLVGMTLWLAGSPLSSRATPPQQKQTIRPSATIQDSTIRLLPSGASFKIPPAWVDWNRSNGGNLFLSPEELEKAKIGVGEWNRQFAEVVNATLPFEKCSA